MKKIASVLAIATLAIAFALSTASASTLEEVKKRGKLNCGVNPLYAGFSVLDEKGIWQETESRPAA